MSICSKRNCNNEKYKEYSKCLFHCEKKEFNHNDTVSFWNNIREKYVIFDGYDNIVNDIEIENIIFPKFIKNDYNNNNFYIYNYQDFQNKLTFKDCTFINNFDLFGFCVNSKILFVNCIFHGDIIADSINELELNSCEFKNEVQFGNKRYKNVKIHENTKFIKNIKINVEESVYIKDSVFRNKFQVKGTSQLNIIIDETQFDKEFTTDSIQNIKINNSQLRSEVSFINRHNEIYLEKIDFKKNVSFDNVNNLELKEINFLKECIFKENGIKNIIIEDSEINDLSLCGLNELSFINTRINGEVKLKSINSLLKIEDTEIKKLFDISGIKSLYIEKSTFQDKFQHENTSENIVIINSNFLNINIFTTKVVSFSDSLVRDSISLNGGYFDFIDIVNCEVHNKINFSDAKDIKINDLKEYPVINLEGNSSSQVFIDKSRIQELNGTNISNLEINNNTIIKFLKLNSLEKLSLDNVKIKEVCILPKLNNLKISNNSIFFKKLDCMESKNIIIENVELREDIEIHGSIQSLSISECDIKGKVQSSNIVEKFTIDKSIFHDDINFSKSKYTSLIINDSDFKKNIDFKESIIKEVNFTSIELLDNSKNIFNGDLDFSFAEIKNIGIKNTIFNKTIIFNKLRNILEFNNLENVNFTEKILINDTELKDIFKDSINISINELIISNSILSTNNAVVNMIGKDSIQVKDITVEKLKMKEVSFQSDINFENLEVNNFEILNSNIEKVFRLKKCFVKDFVSTDNIFEDLQIIDNKYNKNKNIKRNINLSNTTVKSGVFDKLKFDNFVMNDAHVSEAKIGYVEFTNASRETNRFFKNYYDSISDYITANKYYQREMIEQMKDCKDWKSSEWWILFFNKKISNFGESWLFPLLWMLFFTLFFYRIANYDLLSIEGFRQNHVVWMINDIIKFTNPFSKTSSSSYGSFYWAWMFHKLLISVFIYHFVVSVKRKTKR
ncbi:hypothetical protein [Poseidonibacter lekithochrous]|uniref:hypothetical protein n=1 Tax=Poseidonibacter lekithochrous TaxID=1904463 RepID=UPI0008FC363D|nr:hypothetical protein [Poseidonibacter lekithochrous]QKJ23370.1 hypothetical protein ALEK_2109 [Poseidonibacter lekithochrous]